MFLIFDNTADNRTVFYFWLNNKFIHKVFVSKNKNTNPAFYLDKLLGSLNVPLTDVKGIGVVSGGEKFTAARLATTFANTLAFSLKIPVIRLEKGFDQADALDLISSAVAGKYIMPVYTGEARVG